MVDPSSELLTVMLKLLQYPTADSTNVCKFWKKLFKDIYSINKEEAKKARIASMENILKDALLVCLNRIKLPDETFMSLNKSSEQSEEFVDVMDSRYYFRRILKYIGACLGAKTSWTVVSARLKSDIEGVTANPGSPSVWASLEATLTCLGELLICITHCTLPYRCNKTRYGISKRPLPPNTQHDKGRNSATALNSWDLNGRCPTILRA